MDYRRQKQTIIGLVSLVTVLGGIFVLTVFFVDRSENVPPEGPPSAPSEKPVLKNPEVVFTDFFEVRKQGTHDAVALVKNPNLEYGASEILYDFVFTDSLNKELLKVGGKTFFLPGEERYVIEPAIRIPGDPAGVTFRVVEVEWRGLGPFSSSGLDIEEANLQRDETVRTTRFSGVVRNRTPYNLQNVEVNVVLYDSAQGDAVAAGKTNMQLLLHDTARAFQVVWPHVLPPDLRIDAQTESDFLENSNFIRDYADPEKFREYY